LSWLRRHRRDFVAARRSAEGCWQVHRQPRDDWTHEIDLRPWIEPK
jgi:hypothetical protein